MVNLSSIIAATALYAAAFTVAQGTTSLSSLSCGSKTYTKQQVDDAVAEGCKLFSNNQQVGRQNYPHKFNNFENLVFATSGPYQEFPIISNGVFTGGSPGADRVVFTPNYQGQCVYVGAMTHTGAPTNNGFVSCSEKSAGRPGTGSGSSTSSTTSSATSAPTGSNTASPEGSGAGRMASLGQGLAIGLMAWAFVL
ncbi:Ribonuclease/ribotoxin [Podospora fimiseda]|uniref:ribonuclease T1 n=1 Tax=Podospora fimiseda TaxID=252190 RepID=A0AAN7BNJ7_9PEZI|nr:Ribonuclease/ribotoxin [Podospora fimiseda]